MRIGIDGTTFCDASGGRGAGIEHYTWSIVFAMASFAQKHDFLITVPRHFSSVGEAEFSHLRNVHFLRPFLPKVSFISRHMAMPAKLATKKIDVLFGPSGQVPLGWRGKSVITIHDLSIYSHPEWFPKERAKNFSTKIVVPRSIDRASKIITVSQFTKSQIEKFFPESSGKVSVVSEGVSVPEGVFHKDDGEYCAPDRHIAEDVVLYLGTIEPRKNLTVAVRAFDRFLTMHPDRVQTTRFVIAGKRGWGTEEILSTIVQVNQKWQSKIGEDVVKLFGYVTEQEKWHLLHQASALLFPSLEEGFGLPVLEAQAIGTPVITSTRGSLPEVGGDAALYIEPDDEEGMALAIAQCVLVPDGVKALSEEGKKNAARFTWHRAGKETLKVIESV